MQQPRINTPRELLVDDLKRLLTVETMLARVMLPKLLEEVEDEELSSAFEQHHQETTRHVDKVEEALRALGENPAGKDAPGLEGLKQEHDSGIGDVAPALRASFDAGAAIGAEHYEIAVYSSALLLAKSLGEGVVASVVEGILDQEKHALEKLESIAERLAQDGANPST